MRVHLTRAATFGPICQYLENGGTSVFRRLERVGIAPEVFGTPEALVPLRQCCEFVERTMAGEGIEHIGLEAGGRAAIGDFGLFGMALRQSLTLKHLLEKLVGLMPLVDSGATTWLEPWAESDAVRLCIGHDVDVARAQANEYGMMLLIDAVRMVAGPKWRPRVVWLNRRVGGGELSRFEALSEAEVRWEGRFAAFLIPRRLLTEEVPRDSARAKAQTDVAGSLRSNAPPEDLVGSVMCAIGGGMKSRVPTVSEVADLAGTNSRAMQRRLRSQGTSFRELLDRVRFEEASALLGDGSAHVSEIAYGLGYTDLSNFTHAFVRWTGISPTEYRRRKRAE